MKKLIVSSLLMIVLVLNAIPVFAYNGTIGDTSPGTAVEVTDGFNTENTGYRVSLKEYDSGQGGWFGVTGSYMDFWFTKPDLAPTDKEFYRLASQAESAATKDSFGKTQLSPIYAGTAADLAHFTKEWNKEVGKGLTAPKEMPTSAANTPISFEYIDNPLPYYSSVGGYTGSITFIGLPNALTCEFKEGSIVLPPRLGIGGESDEDAAKYLKNKVGAVYLSFDEVTRDGVGWGLHTIDIDKESSMATYNAKVDGMPGFDITPTPQRELDNATIVKVYEDASGKHIATHIQKDVPSDIQIKT